MADKEVTQEIVAFLRERSALRVKYRDHWVVFSGESFQGAFDRYEAAARFAIEQFKGKPFLVRNLEAEDEQVPLIFAE